MTKHDWAELLLKLFAITQIPVGIFTAISVVASSAYYVTQPAMGGWYLVSIAVSVGALPFLFAFILWRKAKSIANWIWIGERRRKSSSASLRLTQSTMFTIKRAGLVGIGVYIFVTHFSVWINGISNFFISYFELSSFGGFDSFIWGPALQLAGEVLQFVLAVALITNPTRVIVWLDKVQNTWDLLVE